MKNRIYKTTLVGLCLLFMGCSDFLAESSQDEVRPESVDDLEQLLLGEGYPMKGYFAGYLDLLTDDMGSNYTDNVTQKQKLQNGASVFAWRSDMYEQMTNQNILYCNSWKLYYEHIMGCNVVLDNLDAVQGKEDKRENLRGQALAMRAYYYFMLVNLYAIPYNAEGVDVNAAPGVPLILTSAVKDEFPARASIATVYERIEKDLLAATVLLDKYGRNNIKYKVTDLFPYVLLSRMYLYMENWTEAEKYASVVIGRSPELRNLAAFYTGDAEKDTPYNVMRLNSPEMIWGYSSSDDIMPFSMAPTLTDSQGPAYGISSDLLGLYEAGSGNNLKDLRLKFYFVQYIQFVGGMKILPLNGNKSLWSGTSEVTKGMRVAEMYLNRAESRVHLYLQNSDEEMRKAALEDLNYLREHRYDTRNAEYIPVDHSSADLLNFYKAERRRELCFEEHRWFDLRRYGMPELKHEQTLEKGQTQVVVLTEKSDRYTLPIPKVVLERNPALVPNP